MRGVPFACAPLLSPQLVKPDSNPGFKIKLLLHTLGTGVLVGVAVGPMGVLVGVAVGPTGVLVGVAVGGTGVLVGVGPPLLLVKHISSSRKGTAAEALSA